MSLNKLISIHDAVYNAFEDTGLDVVSRTPLFMRWAVTAEKIIGSFYGWKQLIIVAEGKGCRVPLPIECMRVQRIVKGDYGCKCDTLMNDVGNWAIANLTGAFINTGQTGQSPFLIVDSPAQGGDYGCWDNNYTIQNNNLVFGRSVDKMKFTIKYLGYERDCDGFLLVSENHIEALTAYIKWQIAAMSRYTPNKMDVVDITMNKAEWERLRNIARADDAELTPQDQREIAWLLRDPYAGFGICLNYGVDPIAPWSNYFI